VDKNRDEKQAAYERRRAEMMRLMERHIDAESTPAELAVDACVSRYHFQRVFRGVMGETPGELQRRLRLERAAHELRHSAADITTIAFDAGYASLEGFSRAFRRAYGKSPSEFRKSPRSRPDLQGASRVHFDAQTSSLRTVPYQSGGKQMDLVDRLLDDDYRSKRGLLQVALQLTDAQLDAPQFCQIKQVPWAEPDKTLRETLHRMIDMGWWVGELFTAIKWKHVNNGPDDNAHSVDEMIAHLDNFYAIYAPFVQHVKENNLWEETWVDNACDPPETFTYASLIVAGLERGIFRRWMARHLLVQLGLPVQW
jgi:AraC-like DNA-binding protein